MVLENFIVDAPIVWDRVGKKIFENPHVKQGRKMRVQITNAGMVEDLSGYTLALGWRHTVSGVEGLDVFEDSSEANVGIFEMSYTENLMTNLGNLKASLVLTSSEDMVIAESNDFYVKVDDSPFGADAEQGVGSYTRLAQILLNEEVRQEAYLTNEARIAAIETGVKHEVTNIIEANSDFSSVSGLSLFGATVAASGNVLTITGNGTSSLPNAGFNINNLPTGSKVYMRVWARVLNSECTKITLRSESTEIASRANPVSWQWYEVSGIRIKSGSLETALNMEMTHTYASSAAANGKQMEVKWAVAINLTDDFGAGTEPTADYAGMMLKIFPDKYFTGTKFVYPLQVLANDMADAYQVIDDKFDAFVQTNIVQDEVAEVFNNLEETYAQDIVSVKQQLEQKANETDLVIERARITNLATLATGSTTGDAELIDGRVGSDGTTYANIGAAIRGQASKLNTELTDFKTDVSLFLEPENLLNPTDSDYKAGFFIAPTTGNLSSNASYDTTGHIKVTQGLRVSLTARDTMNVRFKQNMRFVAAYDAAGNIMRGSGSSVDTTYYVVPIGVATIRASFINRTDWTKRAIFEVALDDETTKPYVEYFDPHYKTIVVTDKTLAIENESADAKAVGDALSEINGNIIAYKNPTGVAKEATLGANVAITIPTFPQMLKTGQSFSYSAKFASFGSSDIVSVGFINPEYGNYQSWMEISVDRVKWMLSGKSAILNTLHGLTISDYLNVSVEISPSTAQIKFTVTTVGGSYSFTQVSDSTRLNAIGTLTAKSTMATTDVVLSGTCKQFKYHTWLLGDSYFGNGLDRLGGRLIEWGYASGVLFDGLGGLNSQRGYAELQKLLTYGTPKTLVWYLGMNDNATTVATYFPLVEQLCDQLGIELIFNKIPFVPSRLVVNAAVNNYVLASGRRYVDSYAAVGADTSGNWYTGHLSVDGVHPSNLGAAALTSRLVADVPEILSASN